MLYKSTCIFKTVQYINGYNTKTEMDSMWYSAYIIKQIHFEGKIPYTFDATKEMTKSNFHGNICL